MSAPTPLSPPQPDWAERSRQAVWHPCTQMKQHSGADALPLVPIARGEGVWLHDFDGARYLDAMRNAANFAFGNRLFLGLMAVRVLSEVLGRDVGARLVDRSLLAQRIRLLGQVGPER